MSFVQNAIPLPARVLRILDPKKVEKQAKRRGANRYKKHGLEPLFLPDSLSYFPIFPEVSRWDMIYGIPMLLLFL